MGVGCWRNPLLLLAALVLAARLGHFQRWEGFQEKSMSKANMNSTLQFFMETYNNASNDTYLFQVDKLLRSQMQQSSLIMNTKTLCTLECQQMASVFDFSYLWSMLKVSMKALQDANTWMELPFDEDKGALHPEVLQLTTGVEYMISVKISRTKCKRNSTSNSCPIQSKKKLKKSFICDFLVYTVPWMNYYQLWNNSCLEA